MGKGVWAVGVALGGLLLAGSLGKTQEGPLPANVVYDQGKRLLRVYQWDAAREKFLAAIAADPQGEWGARAHLWYAHSYLDTGKPEIAEPILDLVIAQRAYFPAVVAQAWTHKGAMRVERQEYEQAIPFFEKARDLNATPFTAAEAWLNLAEVHCRLKDYERALADAAEAEKISQDGFILESLYYWRGVCYSYLQRWEDSLAAWRASLALNRSPQVNAASRLSIVDTYHWMGKDDEAIGEAEAIARDYALLYQHAAQALAKIVEIERERGNQERALAVLRRMEEVYPYASSTLVVRQWFARGAPPPEAAPGQP